VPHVTDWRGIAEAGFGVPAGAGLDSLAVELAEALADPDPDVRDGPAYAVLATWLERGVLDAQLAGLGETMATRFADSRVQARSFAALVLAWVIERGGYDEWWVQAFEHWYPAETDVRGYEPGVGWLHAVAHGADLLSVLGRHPQVRPQRMLAIAAARMLADTDLVWRDQEEDRLGYAIARTLGRPELTAEQSTDWLEPVDERFATGEPGPVPAYASNTMRTLRVLYLLADRGVRAEPGGPAEELPHREVIKQRLAQSLSAVAWSTG
jgi:hypothetical protein